MPLASERGEDRRGRGSIQERANGALRVRVYTGYDPVTGKRHYISEIIQPGPRAWAQANVALTRLVNQVDERRNPKTNASMSRLLDRYLAVIDVDESTMAGYRGYIENHIRPVLGDLPVGRVDGEVLDSFYAEPRRCRQRCSRQRGLIDHRTGGNPECDKRCRPHVCNPLAASTVRQIHWILSGAFDRAVRWHWISVTPSGSAEPPPPPRPNPEPPSPAEAARIVAEAWKDDAWGTFVWTAMTTGARRGELCALRRSNLDSVTGVLRVPSSVRGSRAHMQEKDTKTHQQRRVALDKETKQLLLDHMARQDEAAKQLGVKIRDDAFLFSLDPDCRRPPVPDSVSQRFDRMVGRLGIETTIHTLRHYNATELLTAGVDLRTVAGRLGHAGGGATSLRVYAAWVDKVNSNAAEVLLAVCRSATKNNLGLVDFAHRPLPGLSGGERQRVALANGPGLLLADEPTSQLDSGARTQVLDLVDEAAARWGATVVVVTHDPVVAARWPRTVTIRDGRVGAEGRHGRDLAVVGADGSLQLPDRLRRTWPAGTLVEIEDDGDRLVLRREEQP